MDYQLVFASLISNFEYDAFRRRRHLFARILPKAPSVQPESGAASLCGLPIRDGPQEDGVRTQQGLISGRICSDI